MSERAATACWREDASAPRPALRRERVGAAAEGPATGARRAGRGERQAGDPEHLSDGLRQGARKRGGVVRVGSWK